MRRWETLTTDRCSVWVFYGLLMLSLLAFIPSLDSFAQGDVELYENVAVDLTAGVLPYRDRVLEYPPYVIPIILLPRLFQVFGVSYEMGFKYQILLVDWLLKVCLFVIGMREANKMRSFLPLVCYCMVVPFLHFFYLQRFDVWPAFICLAGVWLFSSGRYAYSGLLFAIGVGVKVYPIVFLPPLFLLAARRGKGRHFLGGVVAGLMPMVLLSFYLPWWRFAEFQGARGLQCESIYASLIWLAKRLGLVQAQWVFVKAWDDVQGPLATAVLPFARLMFMSAVVFSVGWASWVAACCQTLSIGRLARLLLIPLLGFIAFNQVLSPQFMIWILPLAALGLLEGAAYPCILLLLATMVTPIIFPSLSGDYGSGLSLIETAVLVLRDITLVVAWAFLIRETWPMVKSAGWAPLAEIWKAFGLMNRGPS